MILRLCYLGDILTMTIICHFVMQNRCIGCRFMTVVYIQLLSERKKKTSLKVINKNCCIWQSVGIDLDSKENWWWGWVGGQAVLQKITPHPPKIFGRTLFFLACQDFLKSTTNFSFGFPFPSFKNDMCLGNTCSFQRERKRVACITLSLYLGLQYAQTKHGANHQTHLFMFRRTPEILRRNKSWVKCPKYG